MKESDRIKIGKLRQLSLIDYDMYETYNRFLTGEISLSYAWELCELLKEGVMEAFDNLDLCSLVEQKIIVKLHFVYSLNWDVDPLKDETVKLLLSL